MPKKVVVVTGASSGIGEAIARRLCAEGHHVVAAARRAERLRALTEDLATAGGSVTAETVDVRDRDQVQRLVDAATSRHGRVDVMIANAGVMPLSRLDALLVDEWDRMVDVNVKGLMYCIAAALPRFRAQGAGHFITTASIGAHSVSATAAVYCATKYAAWALTEGLRLESDPSVRVTTITPGVVESELAESISDPGARDLMRGYRAVSIPPDAVARAISFAMGQPQDVDVNEIVVRPTAQR